MRLTINGSRLYNAALRILARRDYAQQELHRKLLAKGITEESEVTAVIQRLVEAGWLDDSRFTERFIQWRAERGYGPLRIQEELRMRGVNAALIEQQMTIVAEIWPQRLEQIWRKRFKGKPPKDFAERAKQQRFLHSRGFETFDIQRLFRFNDLP